MLLPRTLKLRLVAVRAAQAARYVVDIFATQNWSGAANMLLHRFFIEILCKRRDRTRPILTIATAFLMRWCRRRSA